MISISARAPIAPMQITGDDADDIRAGREARA